MRISRPFLFQDDDDNNNNNEIKKKRLFLFSQIFLNQILFLCFFFCAVECIYLCVSVGKENFTLFETRIECWWIHQWQHWMFQFSHKVLWNMWFEGCCCRFNLTPKQPKWWDFCYLYWLIQLHVLLTTYCDNRRTRESNWTEPNQNWTNERTNEW